MRKQAKSASDDYVDEGTQTASTGSASVIVLRHEVNNIHHHWGSFEKNRTPTPFRFIRDERDFNIMAM